MLHFVLVVGTRPEIIKMAPIVWELKKHKDVTFEVLFSGQHFSPGMGVNFIEDMMGKKVAKKIGYTLNPSELDVPLSSRRGSFKDLIVLAVGDTTTVGYTALYCTELGIPFAHIEAGLRSYDKRMREEKYRIMADAMADYLFCPTYGNSVNVNHFMGEYFTVGNTIVDVMDRYAHRKTEIDKRDVLLTLHRNELLKNPKLLKNVMQSIATLQKKHSLCITFPIHPHTAEVLEKHNIRHDFLINTEPLSFHSMIKALEKTRFIITDSGGLQEESCILGIPCCVIRPNTERPEAMAVGASFLAPPEHIQDIDIFRVLCQLEKRWWDHPYGTKVAKKIVNILIDSEKLKRKEK